MVTEDIKYFHPYEDIDGVRIFKPDINQDQLVWHRDYEDRILDIEQNTDWRIQFDNELPIPIKRGLFIPKGVYHRLIKGKNSLKIKIKKI